MNIKTLFCLCADTTHFSIWSREFIEQIASKIYWKNLHRLFIESFMKIYSSDHTNSYPSRLEPHNLELFRINVTNRLEIFCEFRSSMFSVLRKNISFHESALSPPHFWQLASIGFLVEQVNGELCLAAEILDLKAPKNFNCRIFLKSLPFFQ